MPESDFSQHPPAHRTPPPGGLGSHLIGEEEKALVLEVLASRNLFRYYGKNKSQPPTMVARLEAAFQERTGFPYVLAVTSGSAALEVSLAALGIGPGDEVILTSWSWISCFTAVVRVGARPVLAELDDSLSLDPKEIDRLITPRTKAAMTIHYLGSPGRIEELMERCQHHGIPLIEDCAQSMGATYRGRSIGTYGTIGAFSFQDNKILTSGEGGLIGTSDPNLYERAVRMSDLGLYRPYHQAIKPATEPAFAGGQFRMSELTAAVALAQLGKLDRIVEHCRSLSRTIRAAIKEVPTLTPRTLPDPEGDIGILNGAYARTAAEAVQFREQLQEAGVSIHATTGTYNQYDRDYCKSGLAHAFAASPFRDLTPWPAPGYRPTDFPKTNDFIARLICFPVGTLYKTEDADHVADSIRAICGARQTACGTI